MSPMLRRNPKLRRGYSLLEMAAAATLVAAVLVPALSVVRDAMATSRELHRRNLLANYAVQKLEEQAADVAKNWTTAAPPLPHDFSADGHANIRFTVTKTDNPGNESLVNQLMQVVVTVYDDADASTTLDAGELQETYRTKVAKMNSYENEL